MKCVNSVFRYQDEAPELPATLLAFVDTNTPRLASGSPKERNTFRRGGDYVLDVPALPESIWGLGAQCLWARGESLVIASPQGLGKTTLAQQLVLGRIGIPGFEELLGFPVKRGDKNVLYLAMDRPFQFARTMHRLGTEEMRCLLNEKLAIWEGPPLNDFAKNPDVLAYMALQAGADTVVVDSLKDAAVGLSDDQVGAGYNRARQFALKEGIEVLELHHTRKNQQGNDSKLTSIDAIYGSTWITSGAGSVVGLSGRTGDLVVTLVHLKTPAEQVNNLVVIHDGERGRSTVMERVDLLTVVRARRADGITAKDAAAALYEDGADKSNIQKARNQLQKLERAGQLVLIQKGSSASQLPSIWAAVEFGGPAPQAPQEAPRGPQWS